MQSASRRMRSKVTTGSRAAGDGGEGWRYREPILKSDPCPSPGQRTENLLEPGSSRLRNG